MQAGYYGRLLALSSGSEDHFFANLHAVLRDFLDAPILVAATADLTSTDGYRLQYQRNVDERDALPIIDRKFVTQALRSGRTMLFGRLPKLPTGGYLQSTGDGAGSILVAPMRHDGKILGYIGVRTRREGMYGDRELEFVSAAADLAAVTVRSKLVGEEARARSTELRLMLEAARALSAERDLRRLFSRLHRLVGNVMDAGTFYVALGSWEQGEMTLPYCVDHYKLVEGGVSIPLEGSLSGHVFREGAAIIVRTAEDWRRYPWIERGDGSDSPVSALAVPMRIGARTIGVICAQSSRAHAYSERDRDVMVAIAEQAGIAVENSQHLSRADQRARELQLLAEVSRALSSQLSIRALCQTVCNEVRRVMDAKVFFVALAAESGTAMQLEFAIEGDDVLETEPVPLENSFAKRVLETRQPIVMQTGEEINRQPHRTIHSNERGAVRSLAMAPLRLGDRCIGVMSAQSYNERAFDDSSVRLLTAIGEQLALAVQNAQLFGDAKSRADRDPLTNLFHHRYLKTRLEEEISRSRFTNQPLVVLMMDIDNFKLVNDTYGHPVGDDALRMLTAVLLATCRGSDIIGRYGGDEFMIILPDTDVEAGMRIAERIEAEVAGRELHLNAGSSIPLRCSIGLASVPQDGRTPSDIIAKADAALYQSKRQGRPMGRLQRVGTTQLRLEGNFEPVSELLAALLARDPATRSHLEHVNRLGKEFSEVVGLSKADTQSLLLASVLHDIGKIAIPDQVLRKPGRLTRDEYDLIRRHPQIGAMLIEHVPGFADAANAVLHHHERFDGRGYPFKLSGESIPLLARIVTLIDAFSAMVMDRPYHKGMSESESLRELRKGAGTQFDPSLVELFAAMVAPKAD
ncbi:MAG TPA: diguanylate cyclase [Candidatus Acidoferrales bacterium]|nr:diguanylate cyclase [Candidatus Acidoferrales bacterium]